MATLTAAARRQFLEIQKNKQSKDAKEKTPYLKKALVISAVVTGVLGVAFVYYRSDVILSHAQDVMIPLAKRSITTFFYNSFLPSVKPLLDTTWKQIAAIVSSISAAFLIRWIFPPTIHAKVSIDLTNQSGLIGRDKQFGFAKRIDLKGKKVVDSSTLYIPVSFAETTSGHLLKYQYLPSSLFADKKRGDTVVFYLDGKRVCLYCSDDFKTRINSFNKKVKEEKQEWQYLFPEDYPEKWTKFLHDGTSMIPFSPQARVYQNESNNWKSDQMTKEELERINELPFLNLNLTKVHKDKKEVKLQFNEPEGFDFIGLDGDIRVLVDEHIAVVLLKMHKSSEGSVNQRKNFRYILRPTASDPFQFFNTGVLKVDTKNKIFEVTLGADNKEGDFFKTSFESKSKRLSKSLQKADPSTMGQFRKMILECEATDDYDMKELLIEALDKILPSNADDMNPGRFVSEGNTIEFTIPLQNQMQASVIESGYDGPWLIVDTEKKLSGNIKFNPEKGDVSINLQGMKVQKKQNLGFGKSTWISAKLDTVTIKDGKMKISIFPAINQEIFFKWFDKVTWEKQAT